MASPYGALVFTGDVSGGGTDEDAQLLLSSDIIYIGRVVFSGAGDKLERNQIPSEYKNITLNGSLLDAMHCGIKLSRNGTPNADWFCERILFYGGDLGDPFPGGYLAVCEPNDWIRYNEDYKYYDIRVVEAANYLLKPYDTIRGPGRSSKNIGVSYDELETVRIYIREGRN